MVFCYKFSGVIIIFKDLLLQNESNFNCTVLKCCKFNWNWRFPWCKTVPHSKKSKSEILFLFGMVTSQLFQILLKLWRAVLRKLNTESSVSTPSRLIAALLDSAIQPNTELFRDKLVEMRQRLETFLFLTTVSLQIISSFLFSFSEKLSWSFVAIF